MVITEFGMSEKFGVRIIETISLSSSDTGSVIGG